MDFPIQLIDNLVAVKLDDITNQYSVLLPDWKKCLSGTILAKGLDCRSAEIGSRVLFGAAVGMDAVLSGTSIRILKEQDLDFVYEEDCTDCLDNE